MKIQNRVYFSIPVLENLDYIINNYVKHLNDFQVACWNRKKTYDHYFVKTCDHFVLVLPDNKWSMPIRHLPTGCKKELLEAIKLNKHIYIAYKSAYSHSIYKAQIINISNTNNSELNTVGGVVGTTGEIYKFLDYEFLDKKAPEVITNPSKLPCVNPDVIFKKDKRLLLIN